MSFVAVGVILTTLSISLQNIFLHWNMLLLGDLSQCETLRLKIHPKCDFPWFHCIFWISPGNQIKASTHYVTTLWQPPRRLFVVLLIYVALYRVICLFDSSKKKKMLICTKVVFLSISFHPCHCSSLSLYFLTALHWTYKIRVILSLIKLYHSLLLCICT